ncbi:ESCRT-0 subunit protein hse1 [Allomyces javanicus]|nr:ESCRT-0 subunit protein hse1 [Allomyces javanicus]
MSNANEIRDMVDAATSENLVTDDWAMIMDICDRIEQVDNGPRTGVLAIAKRIPHKNQNVVLHALTLTEALVKNCGVSVQHEISSRPFTEVLVKKLTASDISPKLQQKILQLIQFCADEYKSDPSLAYMADVRDRLAAQGFAFASTNQPAARKSSTAAADADAERREREELELAMALSLSEQAAQSANRTFRKTASPPPAAKPAPAPVPQAQFHVRALYDFAGAERGELPFKAGDVLAVVDADYDDWWTASFRGKSGLIPANYVERLGGAAPAAEPPRSTATTSPAPAAPTPAAAACTPGLDRAAVDALLHDASAVDDLLSALAALDPRTPPSSSPGVQAAYSRVVAMRPGLIHQLKHATDLKDRLALLHDQLTRARATYDRLMDQVLRMPKGPYGAPAAFAAPGYGPQPGMYGPRPGMYAPPPMGMPPQGGFPPGATPGGFASGPVPENATSAYMPPTPQGPPHGPPPQHQGPPPPMQHPQPTGAYAPGPTPPPGAPAPHYAPGPTPPPGAGGGAPHYVYGPPGVPVQPTGTPGYAPPDGQHGYAPAPGWGQPPQYGGGYAGVPPHATGSPQPPGGFAGGSMPPHPTGSPQPQMQPQQQYAGGPPMGMGPPPGQQPPPPHAYYQPS